MKEQFALGIIFFEFLMLLMQVVRLMERPNDKRRLWYLLLLVLLILYNLCHTILSDQGFLVSVQVQQLATSVVISAMALYFGYYFYKAFNLFDPQVFLSNKTLLSMPFLALFIMPELDNDIRINFLPLLLSSWVIYSVATLLIKKLEQQQQHEDEERLPVIVAAYCALLCWAIIPITSLFGDFQMLNLLLVNTAFVALIIVYSHCSVKNDVTENYLESKRPIKPSFDRTMIDANCIKYKFTAREIEVVNKVLHGHLNKEIADSFFISTETVKNHISNILKKASVNSKSELINKLNR